MSEILRTWYSHGLVRYAKNDPFWDTSGTPNFFKPIDNISKPIDNIFNGTPKPIDNIFKPIDNRLIDIIYWVDNVCVNEYNYLLMQFIRERIKLCHYTKLFGVRVTRLLTQN